MTYNSTQFGRGALGTLLLLLCVSFSPRLSAASPLLADGNFKVANVDWTSIAPGVSELHQAVRAPLFNRPAKALSGNALTAPCFTFFEAGPDTTYCPGQEAILDGGYLEYTSPGDANADEFGVQWEVIEGAGTLSTGGLFGGSSTVNAQNFATSFNGGQAPSKPVVRYTPAASDTIVVLRITARSRNTDCDDDSDMVTLFYDRLQEAILAVDVDGTEVADSARTSTPTAFELCSGSALNVDLINNTSLLNGQQDGAVPRFNVTVTAPATLNNLPASGFYSPNAFNQAFDNIVLTNTARTLGQATVEVTTFYERSGMNQTTGVDANECEGPAVVLNIGVLPSPQASASFVGFATTQNVAYCQSETAQVRVSGSPESRVIYQIDYGQGFAPQDTVLLGAAGSNSASADQAAEIVEINLDTLGGETVRFRIVQREFINGLNCVQTTPTFTVDFDVLESPMGELTLGTPADSTFCNGDLPGTVDFVFTAPNAAGFAVDIARSINGTRDDTTVYTLMTAATTGGVATDTFAITLPGDSLAGQVISYTIIGITETRSGIVCTNTVAGDSVNLIEQADAVLAVEVEGGGSTEVFSVANNGGTVTICDESDIEFSLPADAFGAVLDSNRAFRVQLEIEDDTYGIFTAAADTVFTLTSFPQDIAELSTFVNIPNNVGRQDIALTFTPYYDQNGNDTLNVEDCGGVAVTLTLRIEEALDVDISTTNLPSFMTAVGNNDSVRICSGDDVAFELLSNQEATANVVVSGQANQQFMVTTSNGSGGFVTDFTLTDVTSQTSVTLVNAVSDNSGCVRVFNRTVTIYVDDIPTGVIAVAEDQVCLGETSVLTLTANGGEGPTFKYRFTFEPPTGPSVVFDTIGGASLSYDADRFDFSTPGRYVFLLDSVRNNNDLMCGTGYPAVGAGVVADTVIVEFTPEIELSATTLVTDDIFVSNVSSGPLTDVMGNEICNQDTFRLNGMALSIDSSTVSTDSLYYALEVTRDNTGTLTTGTRIFGNVSDFNSGDPIVEQRFNNTSDSPQEVIFEAIAFYFDDQNGTAMPTAADLATACTGDTLTFGFLVLPTPMASIGDDQVICFDTEATLDVTGSADVEVFIRVMEGDANVGTLRGPGMDTSIILAGDGTGMFTTGMLTDTLMLRKFLVQNVQGCADTTTQDITIAVVPEGDASFAIATEDACEGSTVTLDVSGSANGIVYYSYTNNSSFVGEVTLDAMGMGEIVTGMLTQDTTITIDSIASTNLDVAGLTVRCVNAPLSSDSTVVISVEEAPSGIITAVEPVCNGIEQPQLRFDLLTGVGTSFNLTINDSTYVGIADGDILTVGPDSLVADSVYVLTMITDAGGMGCSVQADTLSFDTVKVEVIPTATATVTLDGMVTLVDTSAIFFDTVCSGTIFDLAVQGVPTSGVSVEGDSLSYFVEVTDPQGIVFGGSFAINLTESQLSSALADIFPDSINNRSGDTTTIRVSITPYYETGIPAPFQGNGPSDVNSCASAPTVFAITVADELNADFVFASSDATVCEDSTATIVFSGSPNIEVTITENINGVSETVLLDTLGMGSFTTSPLDETTVFAISGLATTTQRPACNILTDESEQFTVTVVPTPEATLTIVGDTTCVGDSRLAFVSGTPMSTVTYNIDGGADQTAVILANGRSNFFRINTTDAVPPRTGLDTVIVSLTSIVTNSAAACPADLDGLPGSSDTLIVRPIPNGTITAGPAACDGESVDIVFNATTTVFEDYTISIRLPNGTLTLPIENVEDGDVVFRASAPGIYQLERILDNRDNTGNSLSCGNDSTAVAGFIDTARVIIEDEIDLLASVTGEIANRDVRNNSFAPRYTTTACEGQNVNINFSSMTESSVVSGDLRLMVDVIDNPGNLFSSSLIDGSDTTTTLAISGALTNTTNVVQQLRFSVTPFYAEGAACEGDPIIFTINVLPALTASVAAMPTEVCAGDSTDFVITAPEGAVVTYSTAGFSSATPASSGTVTIPAGGMTTVTAFGATNSATANYLEISSVSLLTGTTTCVVALTDTAEVDVNPLPTGDLEVSTNGPICRDDMVTVSFATSFGEAGDLFTVYVKDAAYTVNPTGTTLRSADLFSIALTQDSTFTLDSIVYQPTGCIAELTGVSETVLVNQPIAGSVFASDANGNTVTTSVTNQNDSISICTGDALDLVLSLERVTTMPQNDRASVTFRSDANYFGQPTNSGTVSVDSLDFEAIFDNTIFQNLSDSVQDAQLLITYYVEENGNDSLDANECFGRTDTLTIEIQPNPAAMDISLRICSDEALDFDLDAAITNGVTNVAYTYTTMSTNATAISFADRTVPSSDNIVATTAELANTTGADIDVTFQVSTSVNGCRGNDFVFTLTVEFEPAVSQMLNDTVCSDTPIGIMLALGVDPDAPNTPDSNFTITAITPSVAFGPMFIPAPTNAVVGNMITADSISMDAFTNFTGTNQTVTYSIIATSAAGCGSDTVDVVATIQPEPFVQDVRETVCSGVRLDVDVLTDLAVTNPNSTVSFTRRRAANISNFLVYDGDDQEIFNNSTGQQVAPAETTTTISDSIINGTTAGITLTYDIMITDSNGCQANTFLYQVLVVPEVRATLSASGPTNICTDESVTFTTQLQGSAGIGSQYTYAIVNPDPDVDLVLANNGANVTVTAQSGSAAGNGTLLVTVNDPATGCSTFAVATVTVGITPEVNPIMGDDRPCVNTFTQYTVRDRGAGFTYDWSLSNPAAGMVIASGADTTFTITYNSSAGNGPFVLTLVETSPDGCETTNELVVTLTTELSADYRFQLDNGGNPLSVAFFEEASGNVNNYTWDFGDGTTSMDPNPVHEFPDNPNMPGAAFDYEVRLVVSGICRPFTDTITKTVTINSVIECETVQLEPGINFISFSVEPADSAIASVFGNVPGLIQVTGFSNGFPQVFQPGNGTGNTPGMVLSKGAGYVVIVDEASLLTVCGISIDPTFKRPLDAGVNYVGYMGDTPQSADSYLSNLVGPVNNPGPLVVAQTFGNGVDGFADSYIQNGGSSNDLTAFEPNRGYIIIVRTPQGSYRGVPGNTENFEFLHGSIDAAALVDGQSVEVLNSRGEVIGTIAPDNNGVFYATPVFGEATRADGSFADGLVENESLSFRYGDQVLRNVVSFHGGSDVTELHLSFDATTSTEEVASAEGVSISVFPNPVKQNATVKLATTQNGSYDLLVMDVNGRVVKQLLTDSDQVAGVVTIQWDAVEQLVPGIYNVIVLKDGVLLRGATQRIIKQ